MKKLEKELRRKMLEITPIFNSNEVWKEIEIKLSKKKRKNSGFLLFFLPIVSAFSLSFYALKHPTVNHLEKQIETRLPEPQKEEISLKQIVIASSIQQETGVETTGKIESHIHDEVYSFKKIDDAHPEDDLRSFSIFSKSTDSRAVNNSRRSITIPAISTEIKTLHHDRLVLPMPASYELTEKETTSSPRLEVSFLYGVGIVGNKLKLLDDNFADLISPGIGFTYHRGFEITYPISDRMSIRAGVLYFQKEYKVNVTSGGNSTRFSYNYSFPIMLKYKANFRKFKPFLALGASVNVYEDLSSIYSTFGNTNEQIKIEGNLLKQDDVSASLELGHEFRISRLNFTAALYADFSARQVFSGKVYDTSGNQDRSVGEFRSNGSFVGLRLKYDLKLFRKRTSKTSFEAGTTGEYKNNVGVDILGVGGYYALYYERIWVSNERIKFGLKQGVSYIPEYEESGFIANIRDDDIKLMGLSISNTGSAYIGGNGSFLQVGIGTGFLYGPYYFPELNPTNYGWGNWQSAIIGFRIERKRMVSGLQLIAQFSENYKGEYAPYPHVGAYVGWAF